MIPVDFDYVTPATVGEAITALTTNQAHILAGGQTLIPGLKTRAVRPELLVDIRSLPGLDRIEIIETAVTIGALVRQRQIEDSEQLARILPILREAARVVADPAVRSQGTLVGAMAAADPGGDWLAVALAMNGSVRATGPGGERSIAVEDLISGPYRTSLSPNEMITHLDLKTPEHPCGMAYLKLRHPATGFALVGVAAVVPLDKSGRCAGGRVAVTGAGPKAARMRTTEEHLQGRAPNPADIAVAALNATKGMTLWSDIHASEAYRAELVKVYVRRALELAGSRAEAAAEA